MNKPFAAHVSEDKSRFQEIKEHNVAVGDLGAEFSIDFLKPLVRYAGYMHDIGKYRQGFQNRLWLDSSELCEHAVCGAKEIESIRNKLSDENLRIVLKLVEYVIAGHHVGLQNGIAGDNREHSSLNEALMRINETIRDEYAIYQKYEQYDLPTKEEVSIIIQKLCEGVTGENGGIAELIERAMFFTRYMYSCVIDADCLDSEQFSNNGELDRGLYGSFEGALWNVNGKLAELNSGALTGLARTRKEVQQRVFADIDKCESGSINFIAMPTGSGKTLCSLKLALERAKRGKKKHIIYVIPYLSIIEQTANVFKGIFGDKLPILQHYSSYTRPTIQNKEDYYREMLRQRAVENWDASFIITTSVQFFESLYSCEKKDLRKLHNLNDSIIVFDEVHMLPIKYLRSCMRGINYITKYLNSEVYLMTATMPDYTMLFDKYMSDVRVHNVLENKEGFEKFDSCDYKDIGVKTSKEILDDLQNKSNALVILNNRKEVQRYYELCPYENKYCLTTYSTINDRMEKIDEIKEKLREGKKVYVFSTSLIEAGVDLDFAYVYRELAGLDNIIQSAGRCNREGKLDKGHVYIFINGDKPTIKYMQKQISCTKFVLSKMQNDRITDEMIKTYYNQYYSMEKDKLYSDTAYRDGDSIENLAFADYAGRYEFIKEDKINVIVENEGNKYYIDTLRKRTDNPKYLLRQLCNDGVAVYANELQQLEEDNAIEYIGELEIPILKDISYYNKEIGLKIE